MEILLVAERVEAKKDWNEKPGEPLGENALIISSNKHQIVFALASAFDAPLFFTYDLIRPFEEVFGFKKILNQVQNDVDLKSIFLFHCESCRT